MDFRFRAIDNKPPAAASSSGCSSDHPLRDDSPNAELVKQRIKEEIMIREIARRRMLEAEIRRELIMEQELAMLRATSSTERLAFEEQFAMRLLDQRLNHTVDQSSSRGLLAVPGSSSSLNSLPVRPFPEPQKEEPKPLDDEKDKLIFLPKPDPEKFKMKRMRKDEEPPAEADTHTETVSIPSISLKKLVKEEFICRMCKVTATSEITFNTHLKGKKHKAKQGRALQTGEVQVQAEEKGKDSEDTEKATEKPSLENKGSFKFRCEMCQIGTPSMVIMETHKKGRKHRARLLKLGQCKLDEQKQPQGLVSSASSSEGRQDDRNSIT